MELGTVISTFEGPSTRKFSFVIKKDANVKRGKFISVKMGPSHLIARIADIRKTNRYFMNPESVKNVESAGTMIASYPTWEWEYLVADCDAVGIFEGGSFQDPSFPPSPGDVVSEPDAQILKKFFGFDDSGLHLGSIKHHDMPVNLSLRRLIQKHLALLSISGGGKSHSTSVLIEELLDRNVSDGTVATVVIDTHGEYTSFGADKKYMSKTAIFPLSDVRIGLPNLRASDLAQWTSLSGAQERVLAKVMAGMGKKDFTLSNLINSVEAAQIQQNTKDVLISVLESLRSTGLFGVADYPALDDIAKQGSLAVFDLSQSVSMRAKRIAVAYIAHKLFEARRRGIIPPFLLVIEEAHQFAPEQMKKEVAISKPIISTIAREGRKFGACLCLISQRPVQLSTTVLSQCNTNIILRVTNPYDLKHIGESSEGINREVLDQISTLPVGTGLIVGEAVNFPLFVKIRKRKSKESETSMPLEELAIRWHQSFRQKEQDAKTFIE